MSCHLLCSDGKTISKMFVYVNQVLNPAADLHLPKVGFSLLSF
jgi:hypothetical protein